MVNAFSPFTIHRYLYVMNRMDRLLGILTHLQSRKFVPAEKIAEKFNISTRTVYRDIKALGELGIPISFESSKGYFVVQGYFLPPVSFSSEEANALLLTEQLVYGFSDKSIQTHYSTALNKVKAVLRGSQKESLELLSNRIRLQVPQCFPMNSDYLAVLQNALSANTIIDLSYRNKKEEVSRRQVEPIGLVFYAFKWHLIGWCHTRKDYRDFLVSRILKLQNTEVPFRNATHIDLNDYVKALPVDY